MKRLLLSAALAMLASGCLTVEQKEYHITLNDDGSGEARIIFRNIHCESDDTTSTAAEDFRQLINTYFRGDRFERENPGFRAVRKRLFEEDGRLCAEVTVAFDSLAPLRLFRYRNEGPLMYFVGSPLSPEVLVETNGTFGRDWMPVVFWPPDTRSLMVRTRIISHSTYHRGLLNEFRAWQRDSSGVR